MRLLKLLAEQERKRILGKIKVTYVDSATVMDVAEIIRSIEEVTVVDTAGGDRRKQEAIYEVKLLTQKDPKQAFLYLKEKALTFSEIKQVQIATKSIEFF